VVILLLSLCAWAGPHVVRKGETIESLAAGDAEAVRAANGLGPGEQPAVGAVVDLPDPPGTETTPGVLLSLAGTGTARSPAGAVRPLTRGEALEPGTTVCTDARSYATVRLAAATTSRGHDEVTLLAETCLTIRAVLGRSDRHVSLIDLERGALAVRRAPDLGALAIRTASGVTTGEQGGFRVTVEAGAMRAEALDHPVAVMGGGEELVVDAGFGSRVRTGEAPSPAVRLLDPGSPRRPADGAALRRPDFDWVPVDRALGYRVEIAADPDFTALVRVEDVDAAEWRPADLFLPYRVPGLWWRVSSFDRTGFLGRPSDPRALAVPEGVGP
jgi:hypothetical protein